MDEYHCWFRCLHRSDRSKWAPHVEEAFGHAHGLEWDEWWEAVREDVFDVLPRDTIEVLQDVSDFERLSSDGMAPDLFLHVNLLTPKNELIDAFKRVLDQHHTGKRGRPERDDFSDWRVTGRPNIRAINKALDVWDFAKAHPRSTLWEIGVFCEVNLTQVPKEGDPSGEQRRVLAATVSRYLKRANELIAGVEVGVFPA